MDVANASATAVGALRRALPEIFIDAMIEWRPSRSAPRRVWYAYWYVKM